METINEKFSTKIMLVSLHHCSFFLTLHDLKMPGKVEKTTHNELIKATCGNLHGSDQDHNGHV